MNAKKKPAFAKRDLLGCKLYYRVPPTPSPFPTGLPSCCCFLAQRHKRQRFGFPQVLYNELFSSSPWGNPIRGTNTLCADIIKKVLHYSPSVYPPQDFTTQMYLGPFYYPGT